MAAPYPLLYLRKRRIVRILQWMAASALCLIIFGVIVDFLLIQQMRLPRLIITQSGDVMAVAVGPDGQTVFAGDEPIYDALHYHENKPADVYVWNGTSGRLMQKLPGLYWRSSGVSVSPDGRNVIANGEAHEDAPDTIPSRTIAWDRQTGQKLWSVAGDTPLSYSPDGRMVGCANGIYNAENGKLICRASKNIDEDGQNAFSPNGKLFGIIDGFDIKHVPGHQRNPGDAKSFYSTTRLHFWHTDTGREAQDFPYTRVRAFDISRNGQWLIITSDTGQVVGEQTAHS
ncbi:MAG: WD40 repeat domain-containing protein [Janthinobacterium lividum]